MNLTEILAELRKIAPELSEDRLLELAGFTLDRVNEEGRIVTERAINLLK